MKAPKLRDGNISHFVPKEGKMLRDIKAMENYIAQNLDKGVTLSIDDIDFLKKKIEGIKDYINNIEKTATEMKIKYEAKFKEMYQKVIDAEAREKSQVKRQKEYGISQTKVEDARHKHIMEEIKALKEADIKVFNRSSYPFLPRFVKPNAGKKDNKPKEEKEDEQKGKKTVKQDKSK